MLASLAPAFEGATALVYDDPSVSTEKQAENRSLILRSLIDQLATAKLQLVRASEQAPAPLPF